MSKSTHPLSGLLWNLLLTALGIGAFIASRYETGYRSTNLVVFGVFFALSARLDWMKRS